MTQKVLRTVPADNQTEAEATFQTPRYFVEINLLSGSDLYLSTGKTQTWNGPTYVGNAVRVDKLQFLADGSQKGELEILNTGGEAISQVLQSNTAESSVTIWKYFETAAGFTTPLEIFAGVFDGLTLSQESVVVGLASVSLSSLYIPNEYITHENGFTWLPKVGSIVNWEEDRYIMEND